MNISYQREADRNYMVIDELPVDEESSALRILEEHPSEVFLRPLQRSLNGHVRILYEITSRQNIASFFERNPMTGSALFLLFNSLEAAMLECERYFIDPQDLLLEPEALYYSSAKHAVQFCYVPGSCKASPECFRLLAEFILKHLAHEDRSAVDLGYQFYELVCAENFSFLRSWSQMKTHLDPNVSASETPSSDKIVGDPAVFTRPGPSEEDRIVFGNLQEKESTGLKNTGFENTGAAALRSGFPVSDTDRTLGSSADENEKKKRRKPKKKASAKKLLSIILPIAGAAVLYGLVLWFFVLTPLQMGGLFFLLCAAVWLLCSLLTNRRDMTGQINRLRPEDEDEEDYFRLLMSDSEKEKEHPAVPEKKGNSRMSFMDDPYDEGTRYLEDPSPVLQIRLVSQNIRKSPDLTMETGIAFIGKNPQEVDLVIPLDVISRIHAKLEMDPVNVIFTFLYAL